MSKGIGIKNNYKLGGSVNKATNVQKANVGLLIKAFGKLPVVKEGVKKVLTNYRMTNPSKFMERSIKLRAGDVGKSSVKDTAKKILTSKTNIAGTAGTAGYEIGKADNEEKTEGKKYGGSMKKMASGGKVMKASSGKAVSLKEVYALANRNKTEDRLTEMDIKQAKKVLGYKDALPEIKADGAKYGKFMKKVKSRKKKA